MMTDLSTTIGSLRSELGRAQNNLTSNVKVKETVQEQYNKANATILLQVGQNYVFLVHKNDPLGGSIHNFHEFTNDSWFHDFMNVILSIRESQIIMYRSSLIHKYIFQTFHDILRTIFFLFRNSLTML